MRPIARIRVAAEGAWTSLGRRTSTAAVPSCTTIRRPDESSRPAVAVTTASMATSRSVVRSALATETVAGVPVDGDGDDLGFGVGLGELDGDELGGGAACMTTSSASRIQIRYPSGAPFLL